MGATDLLHIKKYNTNKDSYLSRYKRLYYIGNIGLIDSICITVIGSRKMTHYGKRVVEEFCQGISATNLATVSGFVAGVDLEVFKQSLKCRIPTIAVLGYGFDYFSLREFNLLYNKYSSTKELKDILVVSQFDSSQNAAKWTFPKRDELLASLGKLVLVVEAAKNSGTTYTVKQAFKESKKVFAVPGNIYSQQSVGTNNLIAGGTCKGRAILYTGYKDIVSNLGVRDVCIGHQRMDAQVVLSKGQRLVIKAIGGGNHHYNDIAKASELSPEKLSSVLSKLELLGYIKNTGGVYTQVV